LNHRCALTALIPVLVLLFLTGCDNKETGEISPLPKDPPTALEAISQAAQEMQTAHFTMEMGMDMSAEQLDVTMSMSGQGVLVLNRQSGREADMRMETSVSMLGQEITLELIAVNGDYWLRRPGQGWQKVPGASANPTGGLGGDPVTALHYLDQARDATRLPDAEINGVATYHLGFKLDTDALRSEEILRQITGDGQLTEAQAQELLESAHLQGEVWAGKTDLLPRRETIDMQFEIDSLPGLENAAVDYRLHIDIGFSAINDPIEIEAPRE
jgi:hypothetical protein